MPAETMEIVPPLVIVATLVSKLVYVTGRPEDAVAETVKSASLGSLSGMEPNVMIWERLPKIFILSV